MARGGMFLYIHAAPLQAFYEPVGAVIDMAFGSRVCGNTWETKKLNEGVQVSLIHNPWLASEGLGRQWIPYGSVGTSAESWS